MGVVLSMTSLLLTDQVIPWAMTSIDNRVALMLENIFLDILRTHHIFMRRDPSITISVHDVEGNKLIQPTFHYTPRGGETIHIFAEEATLHFDLAKRVVRVNLVNLNGVVPDHESFRGQTEVWEFPIPDEPKKLKARSRSIRELRESLGGMTFDLEGLRAGRDVETAFALVTGDFDRLDKPDMLQYDADLIVNKEQIVQNHTEIHGRFAPLVGQLLFLCTLFWGDRSRFCRRGGKCYDQLLHVLPADLDRLLPDRIPDDESVEERRRQSGLGNVGRQRTDCAHRVVHYAHRVLKH